MVAGKYDRSKRKNEPCDYCYIQRVAFWKHKAEKGQGSLTYQDPPELTLMNCECHADAFCRSPLCMWNAKDMRKKVG